MGCGAKNLFHIIACESLSQKTFSKKYKERESQLHYFRLRLLCAMKHVGKGANMEGHRDFPGRPVVKTSPSSAGSVDSIPAGGAKIPYV